MSTVAVAESIGVRLSALEARVVRRPRQPVLAEQEKLTHARYWSLVLAGKRVPKILAQQYQALPPRYAMPGSNEIIDEMWKNFHKK